MLQFSVSWECFAVNEFLILMDLSVARINCRKVWIDETLVGVGVGLNSYIYSQWIKSTVCSFYFF